LFAAYGDPLRNLDKEIPSVLQTLKGFTHPGLALPGIAVLQTSAFESYEKQATEMAALNEQLLPSVESLQGLVMIILCDDADFTARTLNNFLWVSFTRCNPSHDIHGIGAFTHHKHWGMRRTTSD